uniref:Phosphatidylinositol transfer protein beta isoform n=1 Tax=Oryzias sinensis TaxID=183150 RepID=A0A8C7Z973_9TELE
VKSQHLSGFLPQKAPWYFMKKHGMHTLTAELNEYMKDNFFIKIETWHKPDMGTQENVHNLDASTWKNVTVVPIDIADRSQVSNADYKPDEDPAKFKSAKTGRGPLGPDWKELVSNAECPRMCAYKLVTVKFKWWGLQTKVENFIQEQEKRIFNNFHRQLFCWIDKWVELTMDDIRRMEAETQKELEEVDVDFVCSNCKKKGKAMCDI